MANTHNFVIKNGLTVGTNEVISSARELKNISSIDATTASALTAAGFGAGGGGASVTTSATAPSPASEGDLWFDTTDATLSVYYNSVWVATAGTQGPVGYTGSAGAGGDTATVAALAIALG